MANDIDPTSPTSAAAQQASLAQQFTGLPMDSLIGGPLNAAANANAAMAATQTKFIIDTCFNKVTTGEGESATTTYDPILITMSLTRGVITTPTTPPSDPNAPPVQIQTFTTSFNLPLITIIPINSLGVDNVQIDFEMEVKSSYSNQADSNTESSLAGSGSFETKIGWGPVSATVSGSVSYDQKDSEHHSTHYQNSNSAKYTVSVHAGQLPIPKGVNTIIHAYSNAIQPIETPKADPPPTTG